MKGLVSIVFLQIFSHQINSGQTIPAWKYVGYENMYQNSFSGNLFPGIYYRKQINESEIRSHSQTWFHEVTIEVLSDTCINISKVPVYFKNKKKIYSDSKGGFFYYNCVKVSEYSELAPSEFHGKKLITGHITECKCCDIGGTAVPLYVFCHYDIDFDDKGNLLLKTEFGELVYKKKKCRL
jgi:hypothetical protein